MKKKNTVFKRFFHPFYIFLILISSLLFSLAIQFTISYKSTTFERIMYTILNMDNMNTVENTFSAISITVQKVFFAFVIIVAVCIIPLIISSMFSKEKYITLFKKKILIYPILVKRWSLLLFGVSVIAVLISLSFPQFIFNNISITSLYEDYYVEYDKELINFPDKRKNLITIYVESLENSVFSIKNGGTSKDSYMPLLENLTEGYINFSSDDKIGGFHQLNGTGWTAAALVGHTAGIPIYIETQNNDDRYLEGAVSIGEVLEDFGYKNYFLMGSDADFAERDNYLLEHGNYTISDYDSAIKDHMISDDYFVWWGYEDKKLYSFAKEMLLEISRNDEPFNLSILTADTHFYHGYVDYSCPLLFDEYYANSYYCTDQMLYKFVTWIQSQPFYKDTTIVIVGDHLTMRDDFFETSKDYERTVYNLFINSSVNTDRTQNRDFTTFDLYPTTLASLGATIDGNRLALGTNLFSNKPTLMEEMGVEEFSSEVSKMSKYYKENILKK